MSYSASGLEARIDGDVLDAGNRSRARSQVGPSGGFDGNVGLLSASGTFVGTIVVDATTKGGLSLSGDLGFE